MGAKGFSINTNDISATYIKVKAISDEIQEHTQTFVSAYNALVEELDNGNVDEITAAQFDEIKSSIDVIMRNVTNTLEAIRATIDRGLQRALDIQEMSKRQAGSVQGGLNTVGRRFKR